MCHFNYVEVFCFCNVDALPWNTFVLSRGQIMCFSHIHHVSVCLSPRIKWNPEIWLMAVMKLQGHRVLGWGPNDPWWHQCQEHHSWKAPRRAIDKHQVILTPIKRAMLHCMSCGNVLILQPVHGHQQCHITKGRSPETSPVHYSIRS